MGLLLERGASAGSGDGPPPLDVPPAAEGQRVASIDVVIKGAQRTNADAVKRLMTTREGRPLSARTLERDLARLRGTQMIYDTEARIEMSPAGPRVMIELRDKHAFFVYAGVRRGGARTISRVGLSDGDFLRRLVRVWGEINSGADVPFVAKSSADKIGTGLHAVWPRLLGSRLTPSLDWDRTFFDFAALDRDGSVGLVYDRDRTQIGGALRWEITDLLSVAMTTTTYADHYHLDTRSLVEGTVPRSGRTTSIGGEVAFGQVTEWLSRYEGWQVAAGGDLAARGALGSDFNVLSGYLTVKSLWVLSPLHNTGMQVVAAGTNGRGDAHLLKAGGLYEIRGFRDATFFSQQLVRANVEHRIQFWEPRWPLHAVAQVVGFVDGGYTGSRADAVAGLPYQGAILSAGAGLRCNVVPLARAIGRVDFAFAMHPLARFDLAFGVQQFF